MELRSTIDCTMDFLESKLQPSTISVRKTLAITKIQEETDMLNEEILVMISHFEAEVSVADAYLAIKSNGLQKKGITNRMSYLVSKNQEIF